MKRMRKVASWALALALVLSLLPGGVRAADAGDDRTVITEITASAPRLVPVAGRGLDYVQFTVPQDAPYRFDNGRGDWYQFYNVSESWARISVGSCALPSVYKYTAQLRIEGEYAAQYRLPDFDETPPTVTVNGQEWTVTLCQVCDTYSIAIVESPEITAAGIAIRPLSIIGPDGAALDGYFYPGTDHKYRFSVDVQQTDDERVTCAATPDITAMGGSLTAGDGYVDVMLPDGLTGTVTVQLTSQADPSKIGSIPIVLTPRPKITEVFAQWDASRFRFLSSMTGTQACQVVQQAFQVAAPGENIQPVGAHAYLQSRYCLLWYEDGGTYLHMNGSGLPLTTYLSSYGNLYVGFGVYAEWPYAFDANDLPRVCKVALQQDGSYSEERTLNNVSRMQGGSLRVLFPLSPGYIQEKLWVESADVFYDGAAAKLTEQMTGAEGSAALLAALSAEADGNEQAELLPEECMLAQKVDGEYADVGESEETLSAANEYYAVFVLRPTGDNHWDFARMTRENNPVWPSVAIHTGTSNVGPDDQWIIDGDDDTGRVAFAHRLPVGQSCAQPRTLNALALSYGIGFSVSWSKPQDAQLNEDTTPDSYRLERSVDDGEWELVGYFDYEGEAGGQYNDTDVVAGSRYRYRVRSENETGCSLWLLQSTDAKTAQWRAPAAVSGSSVQTAQNGGLLELSWDAAEGAESYTVKRYGAAEAPEGFWPSPVEWEVLAEGLTDLTYLDTTAQIGWTYTYNIIAENPGDEEKLSTELSTMTWRRLKVAMEQPAAPENLTAVLENHAVTLSWDAVPGAQAYLIERDGGTGMLALERAWADTTYWDDTLASSRSYAYRVSATFPGGSSAAAEVTVPIPPMPEPFSGPSVFNTEDLSEEEFASYGSGILVSWGASANAESYLVYRSDNGGLPVPVWETNECDFLDTAVLPGHSYVYSVAGCNGTGKTVQEAAPVTRPGTMADLAITAQPVDFTGAVGETATFTVTATGNDLTYTWEYKDVGGVWKTSSATTATATCQIKETRDGRQYRCTVSDGVNSEVSAIATLHVGAALAITAQPQDFAGAIGETATFTVTAAGDGLTYQWQYLKVATGEWKNYSAYKTNTMALEITEARAASAYRCVVTDSHGGSATSAEVRMIVGAALAITAQPVDFTGAIGDTATFTVAATGNDLTYTWEYKDVGGVWKTSSATTATATCQIKETRDGRQYRCTVSDGVNSEVSAIATLHVGAALAITAQPVDYTGPVGDTASFTVTATGNDLTYVWEYKDVGGVWKTSSATTATATCQIKETRDGRQYRCTVSDGVNSEVSEIATLHVGAALAITAQPQDFTGAIGETATFTVAAAGDGLTYQWQYLKVATGEWKNYSAYKTNTMALEITEARAASAYRCVVTDSHGGSATSAEVRMIVGAALAITAQPQDFTGAIGETATFTVTATGNDLTYVWEYKDVGGVWKTSSATTATATCQIKEARDGRQYRCTVSDGVNSLTSAAATLHVG